MRDEEEMIPFYSCARDSTSHRVGPSVRRSVGRSRFTFFRVVTCSVACARLMAIGLVIIWDAAVSFQERGFGGRRSGGGNEEGRGRGVQNEKVQFSGLAI